MKYFPSFSYEVLEVPCTFQDPAHLSCSAPFQGSAASGPSAEFTFFLLETFTASLWPPRGFRQWAAKPHQPGIESRPPFRNG